jgi:hypothetical protein
LTIRATTAVIAVLILWAPVSYAIPLTFVGQLSAANEVPSPVAVSQGTGFATVVLDPTARTLQINVTFSGLTSNDVAAHIHCCPPLGSNTGVATTVPAFPGFPLGVTSGSYHSAVFDLTQPTIYNPAFVTAHNNDLQQVEAAQIAGIESGQTYLNIHTMNLQGGEIRSQLFPASAPASLVLLALALLGLGLRQHRMPTTRR